MYSVITKLKAQKAAHLRTRPEVKTLS